MGNEITHIIYRYTTDGFLRERLRRKPLSPALASCGGYPWQFVASGQCFLVRRDCNKHVSDGK